MPSASPGRTGPFHQLVVAAGLTGNMLDPTGQHARAAFSEMTSYFPGLDL